MAQLGRAAQTATEPTAAVQSRFALWNLGFRSFYLLAGFFAALTIPVWVVQYAGWIGNRDYLSGPSGTRTR